LKYIFNWKNQKSQSDLAMFTATLGENIATSRYEFSISDFGYRLFNCYV